MKSNYYINELVAPKEWSKFKRWHKVACTSDPLSAEERFIQIGGKIPKKDDDIGTGKKK